MALPGLETIPASLPFFKSPTNLTLFTLSAFYTVISLYFFCLILVSVLKVLKVNKLEVI